MASATAPYRSDPMPVIMPAALNRATASAGQRKPFRMAQPRCPSMKKNTRNTADPENRPRQNSMGIRSTVITRVKNPADDHASAAMATSMRPSRCCLCSWHVMMAVFSKCWTGRYKVNGMATLFPTLGLTKTGDSSMVRTMITMRTIAACICGMIIS